MAINLQFNNNFPGAYQGRPGLDEVYTREAFKPDVGLGGLDLGPNVEKMIPTSFPAQNLPIRYKTMKRKDPVVIPKGKLVAGIQLLNSYSAANPEVGVDDTLKLVTGYNEDPSATNHIITKDVLDYYMYGEDSRFLITIANATSAPVVDSYSTFDLGRVAVYTDSGAGTNLGKRIASATAGDDVAYGTIKYTRAPRKPIGFVNSEVYADVRGLYQYFSYDHSLEVKASGSIAVPYIKADGTVIADADIQVGGSLYDTITKMYAFMPMTAASEFEIYSPITGDGDGNYILDNGSSAFGKVGYVVYYDMVGSKGINWQVKTPNGSNAMGTDTFGIDTRLYKFINVISTNTGISLEALTKLVLDGHIGYSFIYINPLDY